MVENTTLALIFLIVAVLYSSVGHGGASSYITAMIILSLPLAIIKPTALILNVAVSSLALCSFAYHGHLKWKKALPFLVGSIPLVLITSRMNFHPLVLSIILTAALICTALRLLFTFDENAETRQASTPHALAWGASIGALSGMTGIGGGVFLSPVIIFMRWATLREASAISAIFILINSLVGLAVRQPKLSDLPQQLPLWLMAVLLGGCLGSWLGSHRLQLSWIRRALALVSLLACLKLWWI